LKQKMFGFILGSFMLLGLGCLPTAVKKSDTHLPASESGKVLTVQVTRENVRQSPNGKILGQLRKGEPITVIRRVGNWIEFHSPKFKKAFIWAPSVGYEYLNLYSPDFYIDTVKHRFKSVDFFRAIFSQPGDTIQETAKDYELFFTNLGLGSHTAVVMEVVMTSKEVVHHGITLFISKENQRIQKVKIDFFRPVKGYQQALKRCGLPVTEPVESNSGHLIWPSGTLLPRHTIDLERKEWDSPWFSAVWYIADSP